MNVAELSHYDAFSDGAELWIVKNDFDNKWWNELDWRSGFLLSRCLYFNKKMVPSQITEIVKAVELPVQTFKLDENFLLLGTSDHFKNKWILLWNQAPENLVPYILQISETLKTKSVRLFSDSQMILSLFEARPKTSFIDFSFIEKT